MEVSFRELVDFHRQSRRGGTQGLRNWAERVSVQQQWQIPRATGLGGGVNAQQDLTGYGCFSGYLIKHHVSTASF